MMKLDPLFSTEQIQKKIQDLGEQINKCYGSNQLLAVGILKGAFVFYSDLLKQLNANLTCDFCSLSFYGHSKKASPLASLTLDVQMKIEGRDILLIDCISDHGYSFQFIKNILQARKPRSMKTACLIVKPQALKNTKIDFKGFEIPQDSFVVGYGLDYNNQGRHLNYIAKLRDLN